MNLKRFFVGYVTKPLVIWAIFFNIIIRLTFIPEIFDFVTWILISQIYLPVFTTSFVYSYLQQMLPVFKTNKKIKEKQAQNKWTIPRLMSNRFGMNITLWLSAILFFTGLVLSFGTLYPPSVIDKEKFSQLRMTLPMIGFLLLPLVSLYYSMDFESYLKKTGTNLSSESSLDIITSVTSVTFFITLSFVAAVS